MITIRYAVNMAMQYNETDISQFLINPSVGSRRFLTEAGQTRILRATEISALYFLTDVSGVGNSARYRWYDLGGTLLDGHLLALTSAGVHNSIPVDWTSFSPPAGAVRMTITLIADADSSELSEVRTYLLDDSCVAYEYQLNWLNKLGGRDTWVFTGFPVEQVEVKRNNEIEYSKRTNFTSPNRIYGYRENQSRKSITLTHQCKTRATAEWLKSELIDSIDVLIYIDGVYYPCNVVPSSIVIRNTFSQDYSVRVTLSYGYDINIQTR